jgi:HSP20 family protein
MTNIFKKIIGKGSKKEINGSHINYDDNKEDNAIGPGKRITEENYEEWLNDDYEEGQLSIDVYQTPKNLVIKSTIAGVKPNDIDISINNDMLTVRGKREMMERIDSENYLYRECYWGSFSRSVILPVEVMAEKIEAYLEDGVLTIVLPKAKSKKNVSIKVKEK